MAGITDTIIATVKLAVPGRPVSDGQVLEKPDPEGHVVVYCAEGRVLRESVGGDTDSTEVHFQVSCFGPKRPAAGWLSRRITNYLMTNGIDVPGWTHGVLNHDMSRPAQAEDAVPEYKTVMVVDQFSMTLSKVT